MATSALQSKFERGTFRFDDFFFSGKAVIILATVFVGFARSYYLAGVFLKAVAIETPVEGAVGAFDGKGR